MVVKVAAAVVVKAVVAAAVVVLVLGVVVSVVMVLMTTATCFARLWCSKAPTPLTPLRPFGVSQEPNVGC